MNYPFEQIKNHYEDIRFNIYEISRKCKYRWLNPYADAIDWGKLFTPIEEQTWMAIRSFGKCPLYPQYPVRKYFVDFGNPIVKVAVECDGQLYHTDKEKDHQRDKALLEAGWIVYRIKGKDCFKPTDQFEELKEYNDYTEDEKYHILKDYYANSIEGLIRAISIFHMGYKEFFYHENEIDLAHMCLTKRISINDNMIDEIYEKLTSKNQEEENTIMRQISVEFKYGKNRYMP